MLLRIRFFVHFRFLRLLRCSWSIREFILRFVKTWCEEYDPVSDGASAIVGSKWVKQWEWDVLLVNSENPATARPPSLILLGHLQLRLLNSMTFWSSGKYSSRTFQFPSFLHISHSCLIFWNTSDLNALELCFVFCSYCCVLVLLHFTHRCRRCFICIWSLSRSWNLICSWN